MFWISLDWDFVTGDQRRFGGGRGKEPWERWEDTLEAVKGLLSKTNLSRVVVRDDHHLIVPFLRPGDMVWHMDEHTDEGPTCYDLHCGNWVSRSRKFGVKVRNISDCDLLRLRPHPDANLFIAWSKEWTPIDSDGDLLRFLAHLRMPIDLDLTPA